MIVDKGKTCPECRSVRTVCHRLGSGEDWECTRCGQIFKMKSKTTEQWYEERPNYYNDLNEKAEKYKRD